jgi:RND family efflux transporter MFP subunit
MKLSSIISFLTLAALFNAAGCKEKNNAAVNKKAASSDSVVVFTLQKDAVNKTISFPAELLPLERAEIFAKVSGYVKSLRADIGDRVQKGQVLAVLEAPEMLYNHSQSTADVQTARSKFMGSMDTYKRLLLASKTDGTIAANELQRAKSQMMADSSAMTAAAARVNAVAQMKDYLLIRAPFSGTITQRNADAGALVGTVNTKPIFVLENSSSLRLRISVPEAYTASVLEGSVISFTTDAQPDLSYKATLSRKAGALNVSNRTETWEFLYVNNGYILKPGMYATASLKLLRKNSSFVVPASAVATNLERRFVIRVTDGKAEWVDVRIGVSMNNQLEIFGALNEGDLLLVRATDERKPGVLLIPKKD